MDQIEYEANVVQGEAAKDKAYSSQKTFHSEAVAKEAFPLAVAKLLHVTGWSALGPFLADFVLHDPSGNPRSDVPVQVGDYIQIIMPGPVPENWVRVIHVAADENVVEFTVQPSAIPGSEEPNETEHFFTREASSTFRVELDGTVIRAVEIGLDESINNQSPQAGDRAVINTVIAETGWLFYQKMQWKHLTDYLVDV